MPSTLVLPELYHMLGQEIPENIAHVTLSGVAVDSRQVEPGNLFVALKGQRVDGHDFLLEVEKRGACAAIVEKRASYQDVKIPLICVDDPLKAMQRLARMLVAASGAKVVAVTGSLGKTTTKSFISALLGSKYKIMSTSGNQNSQVGLSLSILNNCVGDEDYLVLEMGMTEGGHIQRLVEIAPPDIAVITFIALVHAASAGSLEEIARAKMEICSHPQTKVCIINLDSPCQELLFQPSTCKKLGYSMIVPHADMRLELQDSSMCFHEQAHATLMPRLALPAAHVYGCMLAACTVARGCNMEWEEIQRALPTLTLPQGRLQFVEKAGITFIDDAYNAAEPSLKAALTVLKEHGAGRRKVAVIGSMRELGAYSSEAHRAVGEWALDRADIMVCLGKDCAPIIETWQTAARPSFWFLEYDDLLSFLKQELIPGDVVLLKGKRPDDLGRTINLL
ncbi:MAG: UDP-N-acetylmuramoyl-tripeptide--D-alanyl-D-alanine ligase [Verrucomicrobia bacterium]|nr:UDP-N-acetylmuramoyl-tripeptide--D-alanyl-D-alanine ligase [Verrucomicrobiota bacterium]